MRILIVDDETLIRNWLSLLLNQISGYNITVFEACDVSTAFDVIEKEKPELIFTDIKMPNKSGIDLIKALKETHPEIRVVVLSAYEDFNYVRVALKNGALDYLLKPKLNIEDIKSILEKVQRYLSANTVYDKARIERIKLYNSVYSEIIAGLDDESKLFSTLSLDARPQNKSICVLGFSLENAITDETARIRLCIDISDLLYSEGITAFCSCPSADMIIAAFPAPIDVPEYLHVELNRLSLTIYNTIATASDNNKVAYSIDTAVKPSASLMLGLRNCYHLLETYSYYGFSSKGLEKTNREELEIQKSLRSIAQNLDARMFDQAFKCFKEIVDSSHAALLSPKEIKSIVQSCIALFSIYNDSKQEQQIYNANHHSYVNRITNASKRTEMENIVSEFTESYSLYMQNRCLPVSEQVKKAIAYISEHFGERVSLNQLAQLVYLNPSYFSQQFKKQTGVSFSDYLENTRIQNAKTLLKQTDKSITEISDEVGFSSHNYFTTVFKKKVGASPLKYRSKNKQ